MQAPARERSAIEGSTSAPRPLERCDHAAHEHSFSTPTTPLAPDNLLVMPNPTLPLTLAQLGNPLGGVAPTALPNGPLWERLLLEQPWPLVALLGFTGIVAWAMLARLTFARRLTLAAIGPALALAVWSLAFFVHTEREQIREASLKLIGAAARADTDTVATILADDFAFYSPGGGPGMNKDRALTIIRTELGGAWKIETWTALEVQASLDAHNSAELQRGQTQVHVRATLEGFLTFSWWKFDWERTAPGSWKLVSAEPTDRSSDSWFGRYNR